MEFLTCQLKEVISKLNEGEKEEIDFIETIININKEKIETTKEKILDFIHKRNPLGCIPFIFKCFELCTTVKPKERESIMYLIELIINKYTESKEYLNYRYKTLFQMVQVKGIEFMYYHTNEHIFDFASNETMQRAIFDDDIDLLEHINADPMNDMKNQKLIINDFFEYPKEFEMENASRLECSALFSSIKCFKYLIFNDEKMNENLCKFAILGGNYETIHICEQICLQFENCLCYSVFNHRFDLFEWLNLHYDYEDIPLTKCIIFYTMNQYSIIILQTEQMLKLLIIVSVHH